MKRCTKCKGPKINTKTTGEKWVCLPCKRKGDREYQRKRRAENPQLKTLESKRYRKQSPEKYKAQMKLNHATRTGKIKRRPCEVCGKEKTHGHHDDYNRPYEVRWLCPVHHKAAHKHAKK